MNHDVSLPTRTDLELEATSGAAAPVMVMTIAAAVCGLALLVEIGFDYVRAHTAATPIVIDELAMVRDYQGPAHPQTGDRP